MGRLIYKSCPLLLTLAVFSASCGDCNGKQVPKVDWELQRLYQDASKSLVDNDLDKAESDLRKVLDRDSGHLGALSKIARVLYAKAEREPNNKQKLLNESVKFLERALDIKPNDRILMEELVKITKKAGKLDKAIAVCRQLMKMEPSKLEYLVTAAQILQKQGKEEESERLLKSGLDRDDGSIRLQLGRMKLETGKPQEAMKFFQNVPSCPKRGDELKPQPCPSLYFYEAQDELGSMAIKAGRLDEAEKTYAILVKMFPDDYSAWELLAALLEKKKDWQGAQDAYRKSLAVDRRHPSVWLGLARCLMALSKKDDAMFAFRKAENFLAEDPSQAIVMADELMQSGEVDWAKSVLRRAKILAADDRDLQKLVDKKIESISGTQNTMKETQKTHENNQSK